MTCREKWEDMTNSKLYPWDACPYTFGLASKPEGDMCKKQYCDECWEREAEVKGDTETKVSYKKYNPVYEAYKLVNDFLNTADNGEEACVDLEQIRGYLGEALDDHPDTIHITESAILDSGDRTEFPSGAVRDMREGKGRFDVMPLEVIGKYIGLKDGYDEPDPFIEDVAKFLATNSTSYLYTAIKSFEMHVWADPYSMFLGVAIHYEQGAKKYGPSNWRKSIPTWCYVDSAVRHYIKWRRGDKDENHHYAVIWNLLCCIWEVDYHVQ